jgi:hypothetical protein
LGAASGWFLGRFSKNNDEAIFPFFFFFQAGSSYAWEAKGKRDFLRRVEIGAL